MSAAEVKASEKSKISSEDIGRLIYDDQIINIKAKVVCTFTGSDHLMRAKYYLSPGYFNSYYYIRDYKMLQDFLTRKYSKAVKSSANTINKQSITEDEWPAHLSSGNLALETKWLNDGTDITLTLSRSDEKTAIQLDYVSRKYNELDIQEKREKTMKDL